MQQDRAREAEEARQGARKLWRWALCCFFLTVSTAAAPARKPLPKPAAPTTVTVPLSGTATTPDGRPITIVGTLTLTVGDLPAPPPPPPGPALVVTPNPLDFGSVTVGSEKTASVRLTNTGGASLTATPTNMTGAPAFYWMAAQPVTLAPGQGASWALAFKPASTGGQTAGFAVLLGGTLPAVNVTLSGSGVAPAPAPTPTPSPPPVPLFGPREPVGPDVPLPATDPAASARRVTAAGFTRAALQAACNSAAATGAPVVFLPAGTYSLDGSVFVPAGLTLLGSGAGTLIRPATAFVQCFVASGSSVRFTRFKAVGPALTGWLTESQCTARAIEAWGPQNIRVDHVDLGGFTYATLFANGTTATVTTSRLHHCQVIGLGYGVVAQAGAQVTVMDCEFADDRHPLATNGQGTTPTRFTFSHNHVTATQGGQYLQSAVNTHPHFDGTFLIESNLIENMPDGIGITAGSGTINANKITSGDRGIHIYQTPESGFIGTPHDIAITNNSMGTFTLAAYSIQPTLAGQRITVNGAPFLSPARPRKPGKRPAAVRRRRRRG